MAKIKTIFCIVLFSMFAAQVKGALVTYTVTSLANSGSGTLREAITNSNALTGSDYGNIVFTGLSGTINITTPLEITRKVSIDGTTASGYSSSANPTVVINGGGTVETGIKLLVGQSMIKGLFITNFTNSGVLVEESENYLRELVITDINNITLVPACGIEIIGYRSTTIQRCRIGNTFTSEAGTNGIENYGIFIHTTPDFLSSNNTRLGGQSDLSEPDGISYGAIITNCAVGIYVESLQNNFAQNSRHYFLKSPIYNCQYGIGLYPGTNGGIVPPVITSCGPTVVSGTCLNGAEVQIYASSGPQNANMYLGRVTDAADGTIDGHWTKTVSGAGYDTYCYYIATQTLGSNTSEMSAAYANGRTACVCPYGINVYGNNFITLQTPANFSEADQPTGYLTAKTHSVTAIPTLSGVGTYSVHLMIAKQELNTTTGLYVPNWASPITNTITASTYSSYGTNTQILNVPISSYITSLPSQPTTYFWKVGLEYSLPDANGNHHISWSTPWSFELAPAALQIAQETYLTDDGSHTNDINWVYGISYLDDGKTSEGIAYIDGLGKSRQVQSKLNSKFQLYGDLQVPVIMGVEAAYSTEGGGTVTTLPAPVKNQFPGRFGYDYKFFDVENGGVYSDFSTKDFDREEVQSSGPNELMESSALASQSSVSKYYSSDNADPYVDDAGGYPYSYGAAYNNPLQRPMYTPAGVGSDFKLTDKRYKHLYGNPTQAELDRVYGSTSNKDHNKISRTTTYDPNGVGYVTYKDNEGKVIATALNTCNATNLNALDEEGMTSFPQVIDVTENDIYDPIANEKIASSKFLVSCTTQTVSVNYSATPTVFSFPSGLSTPASTVTTICETCSLDVEIKITNELTGATVTTYTAAISPADACPSGTVTATTYTANFTLNGPAYYLITRKVKPHVDVASGNNTLTSTVQAFLDYVESNQSIYQQQFEEEMLTHDEFYVLRKELVTTLNNNPNNTYSTTLYASLFAGSGTNSSTNAMPLSSSTYSRPTGVSLDPDGNLYVAENAGGSSGTALVRKISANGIPTTITTGTLSINPHDVSWYKGAATRGGGSVKYLLVTDKANNRLISVDPATNTSEILYTSLDGLSAPEGMSEHIGPDVYVASSGNGRIYKLYDPSDTNPFFELIKSGLSAPSDVEIDLSDPEYIYVSEKGTDQIKRIAVSTGSVVATFGTGTAGSSDNANGTLATFNNPSSLLYLSNFGSYTSPVLLVSEAGSHNIRLIQLTGTYPVTTISGLSTSGYVNGDPSVAKYNAPCGLTGSGANIYIADELNNRIRRFYGSITTNSPCAPICTTYVDYPDRVDFAQQGSPSSTSYRITDLDGDQDGPNAQVFQIGDEFLNVTMPAPTYTPTTLTTADPLFDNFVNAYAAHYNLTPAEVEANIVSMGQITGFSPSQLPALTQTHTLVSPNQTYYLLKVRIKDPGCGNCVAPTNTVSCSNQCQEQLLALQNDVNMAYQALSAYTGTYMNGSGTGATLQTIQQMVNPLYPAVTGSYNALTSWQFQNFTTNNTGNPNNYPDPALYIDFENRLQALQMFNMNQCMSICNGSPAPTACDICKPEYASCVMSNLDELISGIQYVVAHWNPATPTTFPWTTSNSMHDQVSNGGAYTIPKPDLVNGLGRPLFDFILNKINTGTLSSIANFAMWNTESATYNTPTGGACSNCGSPIVLYSCLTPSPDPDLSAVPTFLIPVLEAANENCDADFERCYAFASGSTATGTYLCAENIRNDCYIQTTQTYGAEPYPSNSSNSAWVTWDGYLQSCISGAAPCTASVALDQYLYDIVLQNLQTVYTDPTEGPATATLAAQICSTAVTTGTPTLMDDGILGMDVAHAQDFMLNYIAELQCRRDCESNYNAQYQEWLNQLVTSVTSEIQESYFNTCIVGMNDVLTVSYSEALYHYTLYNYDFANNLVSTNPPEGIDYINLSTTPNRVPAHRLPSTYTNTSLYTLSASSPDEGTTTYYYDKYGRLRFSQNADQAQRSTDQSKFIYSYIKYDGESRITETGEYRGTSMWTTNNLNDNSWPTIGVLTFDEVQMKYDNQTLPTGTPTSAYKQTYLRGRLASVTNVTSRAITHYSYDPHGRVNFSVQYFMGYGTGMERYKTTDYEYKNLTSRVETITYQAWNAQEKFVHKYEYDDDYRLTGTKVSRDGTTWADASKYEYYVHGPLKSTGLGNKAQEMDYVYNINGWLKAINDPTHVKSAEHADNEDDDITNGTKYANDVFAEIINYYTGDFNRTGVGLDAGVSIPQAGSNWLSQTKELFNGNISSTVTYNAFDKVSASRLGLTSGSTQGINPVLLQSYQYDYLNRLTNVYGEEVVNGYTVTATGGITAGVNDVYKTAITYDANGNIKTLQRNSYRRWVAALGTSSTQMDNMTYEYDKSISHTDGSLIYSDKKKDNRLLYVYDGSRDSGGEDIGYDISGLKNSTAGTLDLAYTYTNTATHKYKYDKKGRITHDYESGIELTWNVYDKISQIYNPKAGVTITMKYNAQQQRVEKTVTNASGSTSDYYVYDANGILIATYKKEDPTGPSVTRKLEEFHMYGLGRLGTYRVDEVITGAAPGNAADYTKQLFEITDHLGSVRAVVKGARINGGEHDGEADIVSLTDYHEFGMVMQGRSYTAGGGNYRFGYQGSEKETGVAGMYTTEYRALDVRLGRWFMPDPIVHPWQSPYCGMDNNPIALTDVMGLSAGGDQTYSGGSGSPALSGSMCEIGGGATEQVETNIAAPVENTGFSFDYSQSANLVAVMTYTNTPISQQGSPATSASASNGSSSEPISCQNVEIDGMSGAKLKAFMEGFTNSIMSNAIFGILRGNPEDYEDPDLQLIYARGQCVGDELSVLISAIEMEDGAAICAGTTGVIIVETATGVGVTAVPVTAGGGYLTGGILIGHGALTGYIASSHLLETQMWIQAHEMARSQKTNGHHSDPKWAGGDPDQELTTMLEDDHRTLHKEMNDFLRNIDNDLVPRRGFTGRDVIRKFGREYILKRLAEFYKTYQTSTNQSFRKAAEDFFRQHPGLF